MFGLKLKAITLVLFLILSTSMVFTSFFPALAQGPLGLYIYQVTLQGSINAITSANVSQPVNLIGTINSQNGAYQVWFENKIVDANSSSGYYVSSNFTIPETPAGNYTLTLVDVTLNANVTQQFVVATSYGVTAIIPSSPAQLIEGNSVVLNVSITAGLPNTKYSANVTIKMPDPLNSSYSKLVSLTTTSLGTATAQITYPEAGFTPSGSTIAYTGSYIALFNATDSLGQSTFFVGITDRSQYHRQDSVSIRAVGYLSGQTATLTIQDPNGHLALSQTVTSSTLGTITSSWAIPSTATLGTYNLTITAPSSNKAKIDSQTFQVPGYPVIFRALNLAGESVPEVEVEALEQATGQLYNASANSYYGNAEMSLDKGTYTVRAYWNQVQVGEIQISMPGNNEYDIACKLTNLHISVQDKNGVPIPFSNIQLTCQYTATKTGLVQTGNVSGQASASGTYSFNSTLPGINYLVAVSKYGVVFNSNNNTINNLAERASSKVVIICPDRTVQITIVDYKMAPLPSARIELIEQDSGVFYSGTTDSIGKVSTQVTLGQYKLKIFTSDNILLNETRIGAINNGNQNQIRCVLYNLDISVKVVDYFGNPIPNVNVQLIRPGAGMLLASTQNDGVVNFEKVIGGNLEIGAYLNQNIASYVATNLRVDSPITVQLAMSNQVVIGGLLVGTSALATILVLLAAVLLLLGVEIYRKTGFKLYPRK
jgi:hypothetical protein